MRRHKQQPMPGLSAKIRPKLDHRETSYNGPVRPSGNKAVITGGDNGAIRARDRGTRHVAL